MEDLRNNQAIVANTHRSRRLILRETRLMHHAATGVDHTVQLDHVGGIADAGLDPHATLADMHLQQPRTVVRQSQQLRDSADVDCVLRHGEQIRIRRQKMTTCVIDHYCLASENKVQFQQKVLHCANYSFPLSKRV